MNKDNLRSFYLVLLLSMNLLILSPQVLGEGFDLSITDLENDVEDMDTGIVQGFEYLDILELKSSENLPETHVIFELTVKGLITDSESITYSIDITDGGFGAYGIFYSNGVCMGSNYDDGSSDVLQSSGSGTSTLEVRVQKNDLGEISDYGMRGTAFEYIEITEQMLMDMVPDMDILDPYPYDDLPIMITEPKPNATVIGSKMIEGICDSSLSMESVEIQIDSREDNEWTTATSTDDWSTWEYSWDTSELSEGRHTIHVRGLNGSDYYYDSISVFINQSSGLSLQTTDVPVLKAGQELQYTMDIVGLFDLGMSDEDFEMSSMLTLTVLKEEKIMVDGIEYEVYNIRTRTEMTMTMFFEDEEFTTSTIGQGTQWVRTEDLATVKTYMKTTYSYSGSDETSIMETTYDPPVDSYNFPMSVTKTWTCSFSEHIEEVMEYDGKEETNSEDHDAHVEFEVLNVARTDVPAGSYDTFAIWSKETSGGYLGTGTPFVNPMEGYSINYYSPELGFPVKTDSHYKNRDIFMTLELTSYTEDSVIQDIDGETNGDEMPIYLLLIPIIVVLIIATAIAVRRKRKKGSENLAAELSMIDPNSQKRTLPQSSSGYPGPSQTQGIPVTQQGASRTIPPGRSYPPPPPPPVQPAGAQVPIPPQNVTPMMQISCPKCFKLFNVKSTSVNVQCPHCGAKGTL
jgi:hypothetical protein